jgi:colanic acid biosynthesis glycosyl transferase WcaI
MTSSRPVRLLIIVNVYKPDLGGGVVFADLCEGLAERGFQVTVRCGIPYYPEWTDKSGMNGWRIHRTWQNGVRVERFGLYIPRNPNGLLSRLAYEASFFLSLLRELPAPGDHDAVMVFCPLIGSVAYAGLAARSNGLPLWLNVQDLSAEAAAASGIVKGRGLVRLMTSIQGVLFNRADVWSTISDIMGNRLAPLANRNQPQHILPNWLHRTLASVVSRANGRAPRTVGSPIRLFYSGNIGRKQDLLRFCKALASFDVPFDFLVRGSGGRAPDVASWIRESGDNRFRFEDLGSEEDLVNSLNTCDLFVITETEDAGGSFIPSKLLPAMATGTPVLAVCDLQSPLGHEMEVSGAGPSIRWDTLPSIPGLFEDLAAGDDVLKGWQRRSLERSAHYDREVLIDRYSELITQMVADYATRDPK